MSDDRSFYERRMMEEIGRAEATEDEGLRQLHWRWANLYRERLRAFGADRQIAA